MKRITLAIVALVIGFAMTSCDSTSPKEKIMKSVDEFFVQAEQNVQKVASGEEFMNYFADFATQKSKLVENLFGPYSDKDGNITGISDSDMEEIQSYIYDRATAYNKVEAAKAAEFMEPLVANYEKAINALYEAAGNVDEEAYGKLVDNYEAAEEGLSLFADYDNVPTELQQRAQAAEAKLQELLDAMDSAVE